MPRIYLTYTLTGIALVSLLYNEIARRVRYARRVKKAKRIRIQRHGGKLTPSRKPDTYTADTPTGWWRVMVLRPKEPWYFKNYKKWRKYITQHPPGPPAGATTVAQKSSGDDAPPAKEAQSRDSGDKESLLERHYKMQVGLYEKYLDLLIKFSIFNFAVTGAILSFFFSHLGNSLISYSLIFPILMNAFFAVLVLLAYRSLERINKEINYMASFLRFLPPGVDTLRQALLISFILLLSMVGGLSVTFDLHDTINKQFKVEEEEKARRAKAIGGNGATVTQTPTPSPQEQASPSPAQGN